MANPQKENGYTAIANELVERLAKIGDGESRILWTILRKTYGFNKKNDPISLSQFKEMTGLSARSVIYCLQNLEAKKMIYVDRLMDDGAKIANVYQFNKNYDEWVVQAIALQVTENRKAMLKKYHAKEGSAIVRKVVQKVAVGGSAIASKKVVQKSVKSLQTIAHTKETIQKTITKDIIPKVPVGTLANDEWQELIDAWKPVDKFYTRFYRRKTDRGAIHEIVKKVGKVEFLKVVKMLPITNKINYFPKINTPCQLRDKWSALEDAWIRKKREMAGKDKVDNQKVDKFPTK